MRMAFLLTAKRTEELLYALTWQMKIILTRLKTLSKIIIATVVCLLIELGIRATYRVRKLAR